jgi:hypothetical protein
VYDHTSKELDMKIVFGIIVMISTVLSFCNQSLAKNMREEDERYVYRPCLIKMSDSLSVDVNEMPFIRYTVKEEQNLVLIKVKNKTHSIEVYTPKEWIADKFREQLRCERHRLRRAP